MIHWKLLTSLDTHLLANISNTNPCYIQKWICRPSVHNFMYSCGWLMVDFRVWQVPDTNSLNVYIIKTCWATIRLSGSEEAVYVHIALSFQKSIFSTSFAIDCSLQLVLFATVSVQQSTTDAWHECSYDQKLEVQIDIDQQKHNICIISLDLVRFEVAWVHLFIILSSGYFLNRTCKLEVWLGDYNTCPQGTMYDVWRVAHAISHCFACPRLNYLQSVLYIAWIWRTGVTQHSLPRLVDW